MQSNQTPWQKWVPVLKIELDREMEKAPAISKVHGIDHIHRVWKRCLRLGRALKADLEVLVAAVYLHDLGRHHIENKAHGKLSAEMAEPVLDKINFPPEKRKDVLDTIRVHDVTCRPEERESIESRILYDADKLDTLGVIGVMRYILHDYDHKPIQFILEDIDERWKGLSLTETRELAKEDYDYIKGFFNRLKSELMAEEEP